MRSQIVPSDTDLIGLFLGGCERSFDTLISRYEAKVFALAVRLTKNYEDAEDVLVDVMVTVYRKVGGFNGDCAFSSWIYRVTTNVAFMKLRKNKLFRRVDRDQVFAETIGAHRTDRRVESFCPVEASDIRSTIGVAMQQLPVDQRAAFLLVDVAGMSSKEAGAALNLGLSAIKSRVHRARKFLRIKLQRFYTQTCKPVSHAG